MYLTFISVSKKYKVHITLEVKKYTTFISEKNKLTRLNKKDKLTLIRVSYNKYISSKFKTVKFIV